MASRRPLPDTGRHKLSALNAVLRGWSTHSRLSNAAAIVQDRDVWVNQRLWRWLQKRQRVTAHHSMTMYNHREQGPRDNVGIQHSDTTLFLYRLTHHPPPHSPSPTPPP